MATVSSQQDLITGLRDSLTGLGLTVHEDAKWGMVGEAKRILAKWWIGARTVTYRMSCQLSEAEHTVQFRESVTESSWGLPPPTASAETTTVRDWRMAGERTDVAPGGGGSIDYAQARNAVEQAAIAAGWKFIFQGGRLP